MDERFFQKLLEGKVQGLSLFYGITAYLPTVIVQSYAPIGETFLTDGIERTTDGFTETGLSCPIGFLQRTQAIFAIVAGENTVLATYDTRHEVALLVGIGHALLVDNGLCQSREILPHRIHTFLYLRDFLHRHRRTRIPLHATDTLALLIVTTELLRQDL